MNSNPKVKPEGKYKLRHKFHKKKVQPFPVSQVRVNKLSSSHHYCAQLMYAGCVAGLLPRLRPEVREDDISSACC